MFGMFFYYATNFKSIPMKKLFLFLNLMLIACFLQAQRSTLVVVTDTNVVEATNKAVVGLGGMERFVKPGQKVGLLINSDFDEKGAYVNPDVSLAVVKMCFDAGASEVICLQAVKPDYWKRSALADQFGSYLQKLKYVEKNTFPAKYDSIHFVKLDTLPGSKSLRKAEVVAELFTIDVFINVPVAKHHATTILTCAMKNLMGLCTRATNVTMHLNGPERNDPVYLAQCITDIFSIRKPDLTVVDAQAGIVTNGPGGPGELKYPGKIIVGTDVVAIDTYCAEMLGFPVSDVPTIAAGVQANLGTSNLNEIKIIEIQ